MDKMFAEIRQKLDELQAEVERLKTENTELRKCLGNYKAIEAIVTGQNFEKSNEIVVVDENHKVKNKDYVYSLAHSLIKHATENEVSVITELMELWRDNKPVTGVPTIAIQLVLNAKCLSEECVEVIYNFLMADDIRVTGRLGKVKQIPKKYGRLAEDVLCYVNNLSDDKADDLLDLVYENYLRGQGKFYRMNGYLEIKMNCDGPLCKRFEESNKYKVEHAEHRSFFKVKKA